jgi:hypothetical protein
MLGEGNVRILSLFIAVSLLFPACTHADEFKVDGNAKICPKNATASAASIVNKSLSERLDVCILTTLSPSDLRLLRNSVFARHGYVFKSRDLADYFKNISWYKPNRNFSPDELSDAERNYVSTIQIVEDELNKPHIDESTSHGDYSDESEAPMDRTEFPKATDFLLPINRLPQNHNGIKVKDGKLIFTETQKSIDLRWMPSKQTLEKFRESASSRRWRVIGNGVLVMQDFENIGAEGGRCEEQYYSLDGSLVLEEPNGCPNYVLKKNHNILIKSISNGCCGSDSWEFEIYNATSKAIMAKYDIESEADGLLTYIPKSHELILGISHTRSEGEYADILDDSLIQIISADGKENVTFYAAYLKSKASYEELNPLSISNLVAVSKLPDAHSWLLRFSDKNKNQFVLLSDEYKYSPPVGLLTTWVGEKKYSKNSKLYIDNVYVGYAPFSGFENIGKHKIKVVYPNGASDEKVVVIKSRKITEYMFYFDKCASCKSIRYEIK